MHTFREDIRGGIMKEILFLHESRSMISLLPLLFPHSSEMMLKDIELENTTVHISLASTQEFVACPACAMCSNKVHSRYIRHPADLPWMEYTVRLHLEVRRFFCQNKSCLHSPLPQSRLVERVHVSALPRQDVHHSITRRRQQLFIGRRHSSLPF